MVMLLRLLATLASHPHLLSLPMGQFHDRGSPKAQSSLCSSIETSGYCSGSYSGFVVLFCFVRFCFCFFAFRRFSISSKYTVLFVVLKLGQVFLFIIVVVAGIRLEGFSVSSTHRAEHNSLGLELLLSTFYS